MLRSFFIPLAVLMSVLMAVPAGAALPSAAGADNVHCTDEGKSAPVNSDAAAQAAANEKCRSKHHHRFVHNGPFDIASGTYTGDTLRGPTVVKAVNLNTIRYSYQFGSAITINAAPNVWSGLTALATTNAAATPTVPAPAPPKQGDLQPANGGGNATPKVVTGKPDAFDPVSQAMTAAMTVINAFSGKTTTDFTSNMKTYVGAIAAFNNDVKTLHTEQITANQALGLVTQGGSALTLYLTFTSDKSDDLIAATGKLLDSQSVFTAGTVAAWPKPAMIADLQNSLATDATNLTNLSAQLTGYAPGELVVLKAAEASMTLSLSQLQAAEKTYEGTPSPDATASKKEQAVESDLTAQITLAQADEAFLNALPAQFTAAIAQNATAVTAAAALAPGSTTYANFMSAQQALVGWQQKMTSTKAKWDAYVGGTSWVNPFAMSRPADCGFAFSSTKDTVVTLTRVDLTPGLVNPTAQPVLSVTVECTSSFTLSAGVAFSTIPDPEYTLTVTTPATAMTPAVNSITLVSTSKFHPLPLALASMRLWEPNELFSLSASFGIAANMRDQTSGGSTAEYLLGPTFGFFRTFLITPGVHFGSEASIAAPYTLNGTVPSTVASVPIQTNYRPAFGLGITFTVPK
ncbi:MAG: hypothetical protein ABR924_20145 [Terracidiphilus sp.]